MTKNEFNIDDMMLEVMDKEPTSTINSNEKIIDAGGSDETLLDDSNEIEDQEIEEVDEDIEDISTSSEDGDEDPDEELILFDNEDEDIVTAPSIDFTELGKTLGLENIDSVDTLKEHFNELKSKTSSLEEKAKRAESLNNLPDALKEAVEVALEGGDYLSMLNVSSVDYATINPITLLEDDVIRMFTDETGTVDYNGAEDYLSILTDAEKIYKGRQIKNQLVSMQSNQKAYIKQKAEQAKADKEASIKNAVGSMQAVSGFKVTTKHKDELNSILKNANKETASLFGAIDNTGKINYNTLAESVFKARYFDKVKQYLETTTRSSTKKEVIKDLTNSNIKKAPKRQEPTIKKEGLDLYLANMMGEL